MTLCANVSFFLPSYQVIVLSSERLSDWWRKVKMRYWNVLHALDFLRLSSTVFLSPVTLEKVTAEDKQFPKVSLLCVFHHFHPVLSLRLGCFLSGHSGNNRPSCAPWRIATRHSHLGANEHRLQTHLGSVQLSENQLRMLSYLIFETLL